MRLASVVTRRARLVLLATIVVVVAFAAVGAGAFGKLSGEGGSNARSDSARAAAIINERFGGAPNLVLLVTAAPAREAVLEWSWADFALVVTPGSGSGTVDDPEVAAVGQRVTATLAAEPGVAHVASYWADGGAALRSTEGTHALVVARVADDDVAADLVARFADADEAPGVAAVRPGGPAAFGEDLDGRVGTDLATAESFAIPITLVLLVVAFGGLLAALLPLAVGIVGILGGFAAMSLLAEVTEVSVFVINLIAALGLGLGIDYALLMVSRFREEAAAGRNRAEAAAVTLRTAGRTVVFSALTVIAALAVMLVFPTSFLRSMAYAGIAVTAVTALAAVVALPALLVLLGPRVSAVKTGGIIGALRRRRPRRVSRHRARPVPREAAESPFWRRVATVVTRRPLATGVPVAALLVLLGIPFLHVGFATPDDRVLRADASSRQVGDVLRSDFDSDVAGALRAVVLGTPDPAALADYSARLSALPDVDRVEGAAGTYAGGRRSVPPGPASSRFTADGATYLLVVPSVAPVSEAAQQLTRAVRAAEAPEEASVLVGGRPATLVDAKAAIADRLPLAIGLICLATFVLLFLFTGSVLLPLKAIVVNGLVLSAVFGVSVWIFQDGHLAGLLDVTPGPLDTTVPVLLFCIAFGVSMDYEVFLLSRIKEAHAAGAPNAEAVAAGLARTGRIVTAAAALLAVTFLAMATGSVRFMQMLGVGTAFAILLDATLARGVLVPAFMSLAGRANWWAPRPLRALHARIGLSEAGSPVVGVSADAGPGTGGGGGSPSPAGTSVPATTRDAGQHPGHRFASADPSDRSLRSRSDGTPAGPRVAEPATVPPRSESAAPDASPDREASPQVRRDALSHVGE